MSDHTELAVRQERFAVVVALRTRAVALYRVLIAFFVADAHAFKERYADIGVRAFARMRTIGGAVRDRFAHMSHMVRMEKHQEALATFERCVLSFEMRVMDIAGRLGSKEKRVVAFLDIARDCQRLSRGSLGALNSVMENLQDTGCSWTRDQGQVLAAAGYARAVAALAARGGYIEFGRSAYQLAQEYGKRIDSVLEQIEFAILMSDIAPDYVPNDQQYWLTRALELATGIEPVQLRCSAVNMVVHKMVCVRTAPDEHVRITDLLSRHVAGPNDAKPEDVAAAFDDMLIERCDGIDHDCNGVEDDPSEESAEISSSSSYSVIVDH